MEYLQYYLMIGCLCGMHLIVRVLLGFAGFDFVVKEKRRKKYQSELSNVKSEMEAFPLWFGSLLISVITLAVGAWTVMSWPKYIYNHIK